MSKLPSKRLHTWVSQKSRKNRKNKTHSAQLGLAFPAVQASLLLKEEKSFFLPRKKHENNWRVRGYWQKLVTRGGFLKEIAKGQKTWTRPGYGLIYYHFVDGKVRYIGKTTRDSLLQRLKQPFTNGLVGYDYDIQRCLLNARWRNSWRIKTEEVDLKELDQREEYLIRFYARINKLWNKQYNPHFRESNFDI